MEFALGALAGLVLGIILVSGGILLVTYRSSTEAKEESPTAKTINEKFREQGLFVYQETSGIAKYFFDDGTVQRKILINANLPITEGIKAYFQTGDLDWATIQMPSELRVLAHEKYNELKNNMETDKKIHLSEKI